MRQALRRFLSKLRYRVRQYLLAKLTERFIVRGFPVVVVNSRPDVETDDAIHRLDEALALLEQHAPARFAHLRRDVALFRVERYACRGAFFPEERAVLTELTFLARRDIGPAVVASCVLHEGVHARIHAFSGQSYRDPPREERICRRAELSFGQALPPEEGAPVIERATTSLAGSDEEVAPMPDPNEMRRLVAQTDWKRLFKRDPAA